MLVPEKIQKIKQLLVKNQSVTVEELSRQLQVSKVTIRKYLQQMEENGELKRTYGGAVPNNQMVIPKTFNIRMEENNLNKKKIGIAGAELINSKDIIMMANGTTTFQVACALHDVEEVTVITDSIPISVELANKPGLDIILIGGNLTKKHMQLIGPLAENNLLQFKAHKAIIGVTGLHLDFGITDANLYLAQIKKAMLESSEEKIVVCDSSKFGKFSHAFVTSLANIDVIVTDSNIDEKVEKELLDKNIEVIKADLGEQ